ncbi:hypothetical protein CABS01_16840 [Colletotrichum abscissum]|uniref:uncharacterized protein n=1 Tax=Colletotrichum abscissum TaxID=1671311 RepID=UPI0027D6BEF4|nr:uncharacterized protein CABS01_16840 [Colletotrichum abscissum]KAK1509308.1 hypothetical protein CABS01_16840 [Colletotrichum abscissum]
MSSAVHCYSYPAPALNRNPVIEAWVQEVVDADFSPSRPYQPQPFLDAITRPFLRKRRRSIENKDGDNVSNPRNLSIIKKRRLCDRTPLAPMDANTDAGGAPPQTPRAVANPKATMKATKQPPDIIMRDSGAMDVESEDELGNADYTPHLFSPRSTPPRLTSAAFKKPLASTPIIILLLCFHYHPSPRPRPKIKGMADLLFAEKRVQIVPKLPDHDIPQDVTELCERLVDISDGCGVVPASIATEVHSRVRQINPSHKLRPHHLTSPNDDATNSSPQTLESLMGELWVLSKVARETIAANVYTYSEAHWNARIHAPLLEAGIEIDVNQDGTIQQDVRYIDATRAGISSLYVPRHTDGDSLAGKMVDYCIVLNDPHVQEAARAALLAAQAQEAPLSSAASSSASSATSRGSRRGAGGANARSMASASVAETAAAARSINHTGYPPLRLSPIAVSIETKQPEGSDDEAKAQLSVWVASHFLRLHKLARSPAPIGLTLPLLHVSGRVWHVYLAVERADGIDLFEWVAVEGTETLIGCYKVLSLLRALRSWALKSFRPRFLNLLGSSVAP